MNCRQYFQHEYYYTFSLPRTSGDDLRLFSLCLFLYSYLSIYASYFSVSLSLCLSFTVSFFVSVCLYQYLFISLSLCLSVSLSLCLSVSLSLCLSVSPSLCLSVSLSLCLSICLFVSFSRSCHKKRQSTFLDKKYPFLLIRFCNIIFIKNVKGNQSTAIPTHFRH